MHKTNIYESNTSEFTCIEIIIKNEFSSSFSLWDAFMTACPVSFSWAELSLEAFVDSCNLLNKSYHRRRQIATLPLVPIRTSRLSFDQGTLFFLLLSALLFPRLWQFCSDNHQLSRSVFVPLFSRKRCSLKILLDGCPLTALMLYNDLSLILTMLSLKKARKLASRARNQSP